MRLISTIFFLIATLLVSAQVDLKDGTNTSIGTFTTIAAAYAAIPATISEPYKIELSGSYASAAETFPINFANKAGASNANTITIRPALGQTNVNITSNVSGGGTFKLTDADHIIFDGRPGGVGTAKELTIANTNAAGSSAQIEFIDGSSDNVVRYCRIVGAFTSNATRGIYLGGIATGSTSGNSNNIFEYTYFTGSRSMINASGSGTAVFKGDNNIIRGCEFENPRFAAIWIQNGYSNFIIDSSRIFCSASAGHTSTGAFGVLVDFQNEGLAITRNSFQINNGTYTSKVRAISIRSSNSASSLNVSNNFISLTDANATSATVGAIEFGDNTLDDPFVADIHFNTIYIGGTHTNGASGNVLSAAFIFTKTFANHIYNISNNIVISDRVGPAGTVHAAYWIPANGTLGTRNLDYNTYNIAGENFAVINTTTYNGFANYQGAVGSNEANSNTAPVQTVSNTDLHLTGSSINNASLAGISVAGITLDIDGQTRAAIPYRGADEVPAALPVRMEAFNAYKQGDDVVLNWITASESKTSRFEVERSFAVNESFSAIGSVQAAGNSSTRQSYNFTDASALKFYSGRTLYYRLRTVDADGSYQLTGIIQVKAGSTKEMVFVYPNPFTSRPNITVQAEKAGKSVISITDITGRRIIFKEVMLKEGINLVSLDGLSLIGKGLYHLKVQTDQAQTTIPIIKQ